MSKSKVKGVRRPLTASRGRPVGEPKMSIRPLTPKLMDDLETVFKGSWGTGCWCMHPRLTDAQMRELPMIDGIGAVRGPVEGGSLKERRRAAMAALARRRRAPGLVAFELGSDNKDGRPVGWVAIGPRSEFARVANSRTTPPVDEKEVWIIPCVTVQRQARGQGVALALLKAAVAYAGQHGAQIVEAYPRAGTERTGDDNAYFGTEPLFRRAGFRVARAPLENLPKNWVRRVAMRAEPVEQGAVASS